MQHRHEHGRPSGGHVGAAHRELAELLDLDAQVLGGYLGELVEWAAARAPSDVRTVVDLGAGTGGGSLALASRFPGAEVVALDRSPGMLDRIAAAAREAGLAGRVRPLAADLDVAWPADLDGADVVWASSSLHEVADPDRLLREVRAALAPGGLLVVVEMELPSVLPDDIAPELEARCRAALHEAGWNAHPDWRPHLERAGFDVLAQTGFCVEAATGQPATGRYARAWLRRVRGGGEGRLLDADLRALDRLLADTGPDAVLDRVDLPVRGSRTAWAARPAPSVSRLDRGGPR